MIVCSAAAAVAADADDVAARRLVGLDRCREGWTGHAGEEGGGKRYCGKPLHERDELSLLIVIRNSIMLQSITKSRRPIKTLICLLSGATRSAAARLPDAGSPSPRGERAVPARRRLAMPAARSRGSSALRPSRSAHRRRYAAQRRTADIGSDAASAFAPGAKRSRSNASGFVPQLAVPLDDPRPDRHEVAGSGSHARPSLSAPTASRSKRGTGG